MEKMASVDFSGSCDSFAENTDQEFNSCIFSVVKGHNRKCLRVFASGGATTAKNGKPKIISLKWSEEESYHCEKHHGWCIDCNEKRNWQTLGYNASQSSISASPSNASTFLCSFKFSIC